MTPAKLTLQKINAQIERTQEDGFRNHLGASVIGKKCTREIWYDYRWTLQEKHSAQLLRLFGRGHLEESRFFAYLLDIGVELWTHNPDDVDPVTHEFRQFRVSTHDGHFGGSLDAVARGIPDLPPGTVCTVSCKTHNDKSFKQLQEMGVMGSKFEHFIQEQIYMHFRRIKFCLYMAVNKNTDDWHLEIFAYDKEVAERAIARGANVIYSNVPLPRISESSGYYVCKFCQFNRLCHFGDVTPARNCRTCRFSKPAANGLWYCGLRQVTLDQAAQKAGCGSYQVHTSLQGIQA